MFNQVIPSMQNKSDDLNDRYLSDEEKKIIKDRYRSDPVFRKKLHDLLDEWDDE